MYCIRLAVGRCPKPDTEVVTPYHHFIVQQGVPLRTAERVTGPKLVELVRGPVGTQDMIEVVLSDIAEVRQCTAWGRL